MKKLYPCFAHRHFWPSLCCFFLFLCLNTTNLRAQCEAPSPTSVTVTGTQTATLCWQSAQDDVANHLWNIKVNNLTTSTPAVIDLVLSSGTAGLSISPSEQGPAPITICYDLVLANDDNTYEAFVAEQCDGNVSAQSAFASLGSFTTDAATPGSPAVATVYQTIQQTVTHTASFQDLTLDPSPNTGSPSRLEVRRDLLEDFNTLGPNTNTGQQLLFSIIENILDVNIPNWIKTAGESLGIPGVIQFSLTPTFNLGIDAEYGGFIGISDVGTADVDITYPLDVDIRFPEDRSFGCSDKIYVETEASIGQNATMAITPGFYETEMGPIFENASFKIEIGLVAKIKIACIEGECVYQNSWDLLDELNIPGGELVNIPIDLPFTPLPTFIKVCEDAFDPSADIGTLLACTGGAGTILQDIVDIINQEPDNEALLATMFDGSNTTVTVGPPDLPSAAGIDIPEFDGTFKKLRASDLRQSISGDKILVDVDGGEFEELSRLRVDLLSLLELFGIPTSYSLGFGGGQVDLGDLNLNLTTDLKLDYELDPTHRANIDLGQVMTWRVFNPINDNTINSGTSQIVPQVLMGHYIEATLPDDFTGTNTVGEEFLMNASFSTYSEVMYNNSFSMQFFELTCCDGDLDIVLIPEFELVENEMPGSPKTIEDHTLQWGQDDFSKPTESFNLVADDIPAVAKCNTTTVVLNEWGTASITPEDVYDASSYDLPLTGTGAIELISVYPNTFSCDDLAGVEVELFVTDGNCNASSCTTMVTVEDNSIPEIYCPIDFMVDNDLGFCGAEVTIPVAETFDNCTPTLTGRFREVDENDAPVSGITGEWSSYESDPSGYYPVGRYEIEWRSMDPSDNTNYCSFYLTVVDAENPVITCYNQIIHFNGEETIDLVVDDLASATDNCGVASLTIDPTFVSCEELGEDIIVTATAVDIYGLVSTCTSVVTVDGLPCGWMDFEENGIGCVGGNDADYDVPTETFILESDVCYSSNWAADDAAYAKYELCGDGELITRVSGISGQAWAGITMRESEAPGSKKVSLSTNLGNFARREIRTTTNGYSVPQQFFRPGAAWLRLTRSGNQFLGYMSMDGQNWQIVLFATVQMNACIQMGLYVTNINGTAATATFNDVTVVESGILNLTMPNIPDGPVELQNAPVDFEIYPNPASQEVFVDLKGFLNQEVDLIIYNQMGQRVWHTQLAPIEQSTTSINLQDLSAGTYFIEVTTPESRTVKKLMVIGQRP